MIDEVRTLHMPCTPPSLLAATGAPCNASPSLVGRLYRGDSVSGIAGGNTNFCDTFQESAYISHYFGNIWYFHITFENGERQSAYCLQKGVRGPSGDAYRSGPPEDVLPEANEEQLLRLVWILANSHPALDWRVLFHRAGVDAQAEPPLDANDAYAAAQVALWSLFALPPDPEAGWSFLDCRTRLAHAKSARLRRVVRYLYEGSAAGISQDVQDPCALIQDCGRPDRLRAGCGKLLYGPLRIISEEPFTLSIEALREYGCPPCGFLTLVDGCGRQIQAPASGEEFYLGFPEDAGPGCYKLALCVRRCTLRVLLMGDTSLPRAQALGASLEPTQDCACCERYICIAPCPPPSCTVSRCPPVACAPALPVGPPVCLPSCPPPTKRRHMYPGQRPYYPPK